MDCNELAISLFQLVSNCFLFKKMGDVGPYCLAFILLVLTCQIAAAQVTPLPKSVARGVNFPVYDPFMISEESPMLYFIRGRVKL